MKIELTGFDSYSSEFELTILEKNEIKYFDVKNARYHVKYDQLVDNYFFVFESLDLFLYDEETDSTIPYTPTDEELTKIVNAMEDSLDWDSKIEDLNNWANLD